MKKIAQICPDDTSLEFIQGWKKYLDKLIIIEDYDKADPEIPMIISANPIGFGRRWQKSKFPFFAVNRQYLGSWLPNGRDSWRVSVNSFAPTKLGTITHSRWHTMGLEKRPWAVTEVKNILIATSKKSQRAFTAEDPMLWAENLKTYFLAQGANVRIRPKVGKRKTQYFGDGQFPGIFGNDGDFEWADLVISYSSAITAEAFWYGKKAISLGVCPTWVACDNTLDNWKNPVEPKLRDSWHEHMSWVQFKHSEWITGDAQEMTVFYQGWPTDVPNTNNDINM
jgi:hypothetical protein